MSEPGQRLQAVLDGYPKFLWDKQLALSKHQPYLVRWVREFLVFATDHAGYTFEQTLDLYLAEVGRRVSIKTSTRTDRTHTSSRRSTTFGRFGPHACR